MNTRLLRMTRRHSAGRVRIFNGLGQVHPTLISYEEGQGITLRIEGESEGRCCWHVLPLSRFRQTAKQLFGELEEHHRAGTDGPALAALKISHPHLF